MMTFPNICNCPGCASDATEFQAVDAEKPDAGDNSPNAAPPSYTLGQIIDQLQTSWGGDYEGHTRGWDDQVVTYSMPTTAPTNANDPDTVEEDGLVQMTALMRNQARLAFELWDDLIAIDLTESSNDPDANITFNYSSGIGEKAYASPFVEPTVNNNDNFTATQIWAGTGRDTLNEDADLFLGGYGFKTYVHEIGHALGLSHPGSYNGSATYADDAEFAQDNRQYSIMSYFGGYSIDQEAWTQDGDSVAWLYPATPMLYDIAAIQAKYGADYATRAGATTYGFNSNAVRSVYDFNVNDYPIFAIWDGGGIDTIDTSGFEVDQYISLVEGEYSSIGGFNGNIAIAYGAVIENAEGGWGQDSIHGNSADNNLSGNFGIDALYGMAGDDVLDGGHGADFMVGGGGDDTYWVDNAGDQVLEASTPEIDTVISSISYILADRVENLVLSEAAAAVTGSGNALINAITGNTNANILFGGSGNDVLTGGAGADYLNGGSDKDAASYANAATGVIASLANTSINTGDAAGDTYISIESLVGSSFDDALNGSTGANAINGGVGSDTIKGYGDDDVLAGGEGNDTLIGGSGADYLSGGTGSDTASYFGATAGVVVSLANPAINSGDAAGDTWNSIENLSGSGFGDTLTGNSGSNVFAGGGGNDVLTGGAGGDIFVFSAALDAAANVDTIIDFSAAAETIDLDSAFFTALSAIGTLAASAFKDIADSVKDASDRIIYNSDTGNLYYDADGSGDAFGNIKFASFANLADLTAADFVVI